MECMRVSVCACVHLRGNFSHLFVSFSMQSKPRNVCANLALLGGRLQARAVRQRNILNVHPLNDACEPHARVRESCVHMCEI